MWIWFLLHLLLPAWLFTLLLIFLVAQWIDEAIGWLCEVVG